MLYLRDGACKRQGIPYKGQSMSEERNNIWGCWRYFRRLLTVEPNGKGYPSHNIGQDEW